MPEILSRDEFDDLFTRDCRPRSNFYATIDALATVLNAHPENPTELTAHEELVDMLREKGWIA